jgi:hypothetical protein
VKKGHWEALIIKLGSPNYDKVGAKMIDLEGNEVDVLGATNKGLSYIYFEAVKFLPDFKEIFDKSLEEKKRRCRYTIYKKRDKDFILWLHE